MLAAGEGAVEGRREARRSMRLEVTDDMRADLANRWSDGVAPATLVIEFNLIAGARF